MFNTLVQLFHVFESYEYKKIIMLRFLGPLFNIIDVNS